MKPEAQRIAIAEACGWVDVERASLNQKQFVGRQRGDLKTDLRTIIPDYLDDLNAMHEAEKVLTAEQQDIYACVLEEMITPDFGSEDLDPHIIMFRDIHATAARRSEAFLRTLGLWKE